MASFHHIVSLLLTRSTAIAFIEIIQRYQAETWNSVRNNSGKTNEKIERKNEQKKKHDEHNIRLR